MIKTLEIKDYMLFFIFKDMDPKRIHTRANPDPDPPEILDNPERILRRRSLAESQGSNSPLSRANSLPENLDTIEYI